MSVENGEWIMRGLSWDDPYRIRTWRELADWINEVGFLPLFAGEIKGFSVEEHVSPSFWWTGDAEQDPWEWREIIARSRSVAYGKFFDRKAGFISLAWLPYFANARRDGYDFDSLYDEGLANARSKRIMDVFADGDGGWKGDLIFSTELKKLAGFGKDGAKNFPGIMTDLQMQLYLVVVDFQRRQNRRGGEYGMPVSILLPPEAVWGYDAVTSAYGEAPAESARRIAEQIQKHWPSADETAVRRMVGRRRGGVPT
ncbi:MAG: hypothetical protein E7474_04910 [Ruminococcaceae bacterium]|nr:hypothetical protein [Oscillospiraceae bacterium]